MADSIIGDSFDEYVKAQIATRQAVLGLGSNFQDTVMYKNNNSAFIRLTSGVNVDSTIVTNLGLTGTGYEGNGLAKRFKLFAARTQQSGSNNEVFTNGIGYDRYSSYGFMSDSDYGYVPPPGIVSAEIKAMNRGSLREANIEIQCHNLQQFQILEILYMRLKYSVLLEWGHNMYFSNPDSGGNVELNQSRFDLSDDMLDKTQTQESILSKIASKRKESFGNYDAFFGLVTNFSWTLRPDGGYNITVTARSMGDVIESLKINTSYPIKTNSIPTTPDPSAPPTTTLQSNIYKSSLNRILATIAAKLTGIFYSHGLDEGKGSYFPVNNHSLSSATGLEYAFDRDPNVKKQSSHLTYNEAQQIDFPNLSGGVQGKSQYYIKLGTLLRIIESFLLYYDTSKSGNGGKPPLFKIDYNYNTNYCLTFPRHTSLDPKVCLIPIVKSTGAPSQFVQRTTVYTYLTSDGSFPGVPQDNTDLVYPEASGQKYYGNEFEWREAPVTTDTPISSLPSTTTSILNPSSTVTKISELDTAFNNSAQTDDTRQEGYRIINYIRANRNPQLVGVFTNTKYIASVDKGEIDKKDILVFPGNVDPQTGVVSGTVIETGVFKTTIVVVEFIDLSANYASGGNAAIAASSYVYDAVLKNNPFRAGGFKGRMMHMLVNAEYISSTLDKYINVETGELSLYDFIDNIMKGIQHALGNVNNFELIYDEENNIHRIIDNTTIPGVRDATKGIVEFNANLLQKENKSIGGSFIKNVNFKTKLSNNFATMTTIGAQKNGNVVGSNSTMLSKWNDGLTDRIITNRANPNYTPADDSNDVEKVYVRNVIALQELNGLVNQTFVSDKNIEGWRGAVGDLFKTELGKFANDPSSSLKGIGFIPFDLELTMLGLSGPRIYEAYTINTTLLPNSYKDKIQFICTGVSHKIADGEWTTTLNSIAGPIPSTGTYEPPDVVVKSTVTAPTAPGGGGKWPGWRGDLFTWSRGANRGPDPEFSATTGATKYMINILQSSGIGESLISKPSNATSTYSTTNPTPILKAGFPQNQTYTKDDGTVVTVLVTKYEVLEFTSAENEQMFKDILTGLGAPHTAGNLLWMKAWRKVEGADATFNPWNSTLAPASGVDSNYNKKGVQNYFTYKEGLERTIRTMDKPKYSTLVKALRRGLVDQAECLELALLTQQYDMTGLVPTKWQ